MPFAVHANTNRPVQLRSRLGMVAKGWECGKGGFTRRGQPHRHDSDRATKTGSQACAVFAYWHSTTIRNLVPT